MNYKLFSALLTTTMVSLSLNAAYASSLTEGEGRRTYFSSFDKKRKRATFKANEENEANKENQKNINRQTKKQYLPKPKDKSSSRRLKASPLSKLVENVNGLTRQIEEAYTNASKMDLYETYKAFKALDYNEQTWAKLGQQMKVERWPSQESWKETVGGQLFFPTSRIHQYQESNYTNHLLQRSDILHGCIFAATFRHSLGLFYTAHILWTINRFDDDLEADREHNKPNFYTRTMSQACQELEQLLDRSDVCYALGQAGSLPTSLTDNYVSMDHVSYYKKGKDLKNQCEFLVEKMMAEEETEGTIDDFLSLAHQGYLPAYLEAAKYANNTKQRERAKHILEEATQKGYSLAWIDLAYWYGKNKQLEEYQECLEKAAKADISYAFIEKGFSFLGNETQQIDREELKKIPAENIGQAAAAFLKAGQLHDPLGFECLAELKLELSKLATTQDEAEALRAEALRAEAYEAIKQGCALGWVKSFWELDTVTSGEEYAKVLRKFSPASKDFIKDLEIFLK
jgi:hypothetical protein